jgi:hypothetical protein
MEGNQFLHRMNFFIPLGQPYWSQLLYCSVSDENVTKIDFLEGSGTNANDFQLKSLSMDVVIKKTNRAY